MTVTLVGAEVLGARPAAAARMIFASRILTIGGDLDPSRFKARLERARQEGDALGGILECRMRGVPAGLGEPFFGPLNGDFCIIN